jgi:hypothetical protein
MSALTDAYDNAVYGSDVTAGISSGDSGGFSLTGLGTFFSQIGTAAGAIYKAVNVPTVAVPKTQTPMTSTSQIATNFLSSSMGEILILGLVGLAIAFGVKSFRAK